MPTHSKWQGLPTEAINPISLAVDKAPVPDIIDMVVNEDRKVVAAVQKEKERIAHGVEIITQALRKGGRIIFIGAGTSGRLGHRRSLGDAADLRDQPEERAGDHGRRPGGRLPGQGRGRGRLRGRRAEHRAPPPHQQGRGHRRVGERDDAFRPRRPRRGRARRARRSSSSPAGRVPSSRTSSTSRLRRPSARRSSPDPRASRPGPRRRWCSTC